LPVWVLLVTTVLVSAMQKTGFHGIRQQWAQLFAMTEQQI
jgi:hypothetical protein